MKIYFSHGKESGPWGNKIKRLAEISLGYGHHVESIDYSDLLDPDLRVERLLNTLKGEKEHFCLVGSSMGGYVSLVASELVQPEGVFLLAPALYLPGYAKQTFTPSCQIEIVHGWSDDVVLPENSITFAQSIECSLHLISGDHRLDSSIAVVEQLFAQFLGRLKNAKSLEK